MIKGMTMPDMSKEEQDHEIIGAITIDMEIDVTMILKLIMAVMTVMTVMTIGRIAILKPPKLAMARLETLEMIILQQTIGAIAMINPAMMLLMPQKAMSSPPMDMTLPMGALDVMASSPNRILPRPLPRPLPRLLPQNRDPNHEQYIMDYGDEAALDAFDAELEARSTSRAQTGPGNNAFSKTGRYRWKNPFNSQAQKPKNSTPDDDLDLSSLDDWDE